MGGLTLALLAVALVLQAALVLSTPVGLLQHRHTLRKVPAPRSLAPRGASTAIPAPVPNVVISQSGAGPSLLEGRSKDDNGKKNKKGGVQVTGAVVVINNPNPHGPPKAKENCDDKSFFKKVWCKMTN
ncbi:hypothetical protein BCV69DRAFT_295796 [Microstroma glucosiphilum]|uniref:Uncharacterized protein n=1 Tax=Pseudomicrostroma glucosiphilum TaxID=1684307 RepID=A0A316UE15_9BASI|nr:hypothetical protein BCV69DRAFT_295796 [Pseudomicrostroma glucosiphilum]PWN23459.1 hypothetical protein BCV69DRAFT_295796 [Pseudomicrostroma glucosiphilum]